jgi:hypothetical protein
MSIDSLNDSLHHHGEHGGPLHVTDYPDIQRFTFHQMRSLQSHLLEYPALSRDERAEFLQEQFQAVWLIANPNWDWDGGPPSKTDNPKYYWTKQVSTYP